jgi:hypothetical protein
VVVVVVMEESVVKYNSSASAGMGGYRQLNRGGRVFLVSKMASNF